MIAVSGVSTWSAANPYRGLWVGEARLSYVNEVPVPLDENNVPIAPDPKVATPTADEAQVRLILHVNGAGQVKLLRDVAILSRMGSGTTGTAGSVDLKARPDLLRAGASLSGRESDLALVTDERLYGDFPVQVATRIASAVFDFGDAQATRAVQSVIDAVAASAASSMLGGQSRDAAVSAARAAGQGILDTADVAEAFRLFRQQYLSRTKVDLIATGDGTALSDAQSAAATLLIRAGFFPDPRGEAMIDAILAAAAGETDAEAKKAAAQLAAAAFADLADEYQRFIAGSEFGDMLVGGAEAAGTAAEVSGANAASISLAVEGNAAVRAARASALALDSASEYADTRARSAVDAVIAAIVNAAALTLPVESGGGSAVTLTAEAAGRNALEMDVARYGVSAEGPTTDYTTFLGSALLALVPATAAEAAVTAATDGLVSNPFMTLEELTSVAGDAATDAVRSTSPNALTEAALAAQRELPLLDHEAGMWTGGFGPGIGDPRFSYAIKTDGLAALGFPALEGEIFLPASHPTNPFRHFRHPDHRYGYDITRKVRFDFDAGPPELEHSGYGVDRITGVYREEVFGLHKTLGPDKDVGLRVEGRFELNRVALIDALNAL
ncbi:MAG: hypothetical protein H7A45_00035 [Verrucomicrobiales bacterium]|nr:hypothetical protein [Verrucomicrobiales bacterium]